MKINPHFLEHALEVIKKTSITQETGYIKQVIGLTIQSSGLDISVGELCSIYDKKDNFLSYAEVVGFKRNEVLLMPLGEMKGIGPGCKVRALEKPLKVSVGENLLGRVLDGLGRPIDDMGEFLGTDSYSVHNEPPHPMRRPRIKVPITTGSKAIDGFMLCGKGQRLGIFAGSGVGKSTLMGMIARNTSADVNVIALIGERGREVREFVEKDLGEEGLKKSVIIVATSDQPPLVRLKGAFVATAIAEYFRDQGNDVMFLMDSVTRFAMAQREIGLAIGEPPVTRGFTPSVFALLPKLLERSGVTDKGSITAFYTVLVDGDDMNEPITDAVRGIVDGHIVLSRELANSGHYPAIDVLQSISRVMNDIASDEHKRLSRNCRKYLAQYKSSEDLINIGAYQKGTNPEIDKAIDIYPRLKAFLEQAVDEKTQVDNIIPQLRQVLNG